MSPPLVLIAVALVWALAVALLFLPDPKGPNDD